MRANDRTGLPAEALPVIFNNYVVWLWSAKSQ
jgi:hypothetical protein